MSSQLSDWTVLRMLSCLPSIMTPCLISTSLYTKVKRLCHYIRSPPKKTKMLWTHNKMLFSVHRGIKLKNRVIITFSSSAILRLLHSQITKPCYLYDTAHGRPPSCETAALCAQKTKPQAPHFHIHAPWLAYLLWMQAKFINNFFSQQENEAILI